MVYKYCDIVTSNNNDVWVEIKRLYLQYVNFLLCLQSIHILSDFCKYKFVDKWFKFILIVTSNNDVWVENFRRSVYPAQKGRYFFYICQNKKSHISYIS